MLLEEFNKVLMPYRLKMFGFARSLMQRTEDAEDVVQDVYLKLWKNKEQLDQVENMESYLIRAVRNTALNRLQRDKGRWEDLEGEQEEVMEINPQHLMELTEAQSVIKVLIEKLPLRQRSIFKLREIEHYEVNKIAQMLETDVNNVRVNLSLARTRLREAYYKVINNEK